MVEWFWHWYTAALQARPFTVPSRIPQNPHYLSLDLTYIFTVTSPQLTDCHMLQPAVQFMVWFLIEEIRLEHTDAESMLKKVNNRNEQTTWEKAPYKKCEVSVCVNPKLIYKTHKTDVFLNNYLTESPTGCKRGPTFNTESATVLSEQDLKTDS